MPEVGIKGERIGYSASKVKLMCDTRGEFYDSFKDFVIRIATTNVDFFGKFKINSFESNFPLNFHCSILIE